MKILYVCQRVPYPPNRGDKIASYNAIVRLASKHEVCVAALADSSQEVHCAAELRRKGIQALIAHHSPSRARWNALRAIPGTEPFSVAYHRSSELFRQIAGAARNGGFDVVVAFSSSMAQYAEMVPDTPLVADFVDLDSQKWALYGQAHAWPRSWVYKQEERRLLAYERAVAARARVVLVHARPELDDCRRLIPGGRFEVVPNGVDLEYFRPSLQKSPSNEIVFTGVMDYYPNVEGVLFFANEVLPAVRNVVPDATFTIVGARPTRIVRRLRDRSGIMVTGAVPDVRPFLQRAAVTVAPLRLARGIQNKVLESLAMATPAVVSSPVARGMDAKEGEGIFVADGARDVADGIVTLLRNPKEAADLGKAGRRLVERRHVWDDHSARLEELLESAANARADGIAGSATSSTTQAAALATG